MFHEVLYKEILQEISNQFDIDEHGYVDQPSIKPLLYKMEGVKYLQGKSTVSHQQLHQVAGDAFSHMGTGLDFFFFEFIDISPSNLDFVSFISLKIIIRDINLTAMWFRKFMKLFPLQCL